MIDEILSKRFDESAVRNFRLGCCDFFIIHPPRHQAASVMRRRAERREKLPRDEVEAGIKGAHRSRKSRKSLNAMNHGIGKSLRIFKFVNPIVDKIRKSNKKCNKRKTSKSRRPRWDCTLIKLCPKRRGMKAREGKSSEEILIGLRDGDDERASGEN